MKTIAKGLASLAVIAGVVGLLFVPLDAPAEAPTGDWGIIECGVAGGGPVVADMCIADNIDQSFGGTCAAPDCWFVYDETTTDDFQLWCTNVDGVGGDGIIWKVDTGTDDIDVTGDIILTNSGGLYHDGASVMGLGTHTAISMQVASGGINSKVANGAYVRNSASSGTNPSLCADWSDTDTGQGHSGDNHFTAVVGAKNGLDCVVNGTVGDCTVSGVMYAASVLATGNVESGSGYAIGNYGRSRFSSPADGDMVIHSNASAYTFDSLRFGFNRAADLAPTNASILASSADDKATGANQTGGSLTVAGGIGTLQIVCSDRTLADQDTITFYYNNGTTAALVESTDFDCEGTASETICCNNLGTAVTTAAFGLTPDCSTTPGTCYLTPAADLDSVEDIVIADGGVNGVFATRTVGATGGVPVNGLLPHKYIADPCSNAGTGVLSEGMMFYNDTKDVYCFCDGAGDDLEVHDNTACF